jgi:biotin carboxyl carrier protein
VPSTCRPDGSASARVELVGADEREVAWQAGGRGWRARIVEVPGGVHVAGADWAVTLMAVPRFPEQRAAAAAGSLVAPMPGKVVKVLVAVGDHVGAGTPLLILEAMKMEQPVKASVAGTVASLAVAAGEQVAAEQLLAVVTPAEA